MANKKIGIFGGSFNPFHIGHLNSLKTVIARMGLDEVKVVPTYQNPLRSFIQGPMPEQRLAMVEKSIQGMEETVTLDDIEISRGGVSYTIDTVTTYKESNKEDELYLIVGADQLENLDQWKDFEKILEACHLIVTSRPGVELPERATDLPFAVAGLVEKMQGGQAIMKTGKKLYFVQLDDVNISATELRKKLREGTPIDDMVSATALDYIKENHLYESYSKKIGNFEHFTEFCANSLFSRKSLGVAGYDLRELDAPTEFTLVASGTSTRHASSLAEHLMAEVKKEFNVYPQNTEGLREGRWIVLDYGSLMIHIFYDFTRQEYRLEELWKNGKQLELKDPFTEKK